MRVHWLVPKQPNSSRIRAQRAFPAQRPESLTLRTDALKKTNRLPHLPIAETSFESPLAGSGTAEQQQELCLTCLPSTAPRISNVAYWRPKKTKLLPHLPIAETSFESPLAGSETAEQQQESCPTCLPSTVPRISNVAYWRPKKKQSFCHTYPWQKPALRVHWLHGSETAEQQQESCPTCLPSTAPRISNVAYWRPKKTKLLPHLPIAETSFDSPLAGSETAEQQQDSCPTCLPSTAPRISNVAYWRLKKNKAYATPTYCRNQLWESIGWLRNGRTAAGIVPNMPSQHRAPNVPILQKPPLSVQLCRLVAKEPICEMLNAQKLPFPMEQNHAGWHQPVCHLVPWAFADSSGALPLCDAGVGGYIKIYIYRFLK